MHSSRISKDSVQSWTRVHVEATGHIVGYGSLNHRGLRGEFARALHESKVCPDCALRAICGTTSVMVSKNVGEVVLRPFVTQQKRYISAD